MGLLNKVTDPRLRENLRRVSESLLSFSQQLKILATVKAAGGDKDSDEQLVTVSFLLFYKPYSQLKYFYFLKQSSILTCN